MYLDWEAQRVRLVLRAYFIAITMLIGIFGDQCRKSVNKLALAQRRPVPLSHTMGWLSGFTFFSSLWDLKAIPSGTVLGSVMFLMTFLAPVADLAVSGYVVNVRQQSRCPFGQGMVVNADGPYDFTGPPWNGMPASVAANAQKTSVLNGGLQGIYNKVNFNVNFSAQHEDVIAGWACSLTGNDIQFDIGTTNIDIVNSLIESNHQYENPASVALGLGSNTEHLVVWSASSLSTPFKILASINTVGSKNVPAQMRTWSCAVDSNAADNIMTGMNMNFTLQDWVQGFQGGCYEGSETPARDDAATFIEQYLNTMLMVRGGNNYLLNTAEENATQGCLVTRASVPILVFVLVGMFAAIFIPIFVVWAFSSVWLWRVKRRHQPFLRGALDVVPNGLTSWMLTASRESAMHTVNNTAPAETNALKGWTLGVHDATVRVVEPRLQHEEHGLIRQTAVPKAY